MINDIQTKQKMSCRLCANLIYIKDWRGAECDKCHSVSTEVLPTNEELAAFYDQFNQAYQGGGKSDGKNLKRYSRRYLELIQPYCQSGSLIDIGSSTNPFPNDASLAGFEVSALDYIKPSEILPQVKFIQGSIDDENIDSKINDRFDIVTAWAVVEHLPRPLVSAKIMANLCKSGGMIFLSTPEIGTFLTNHSIGRSGWFYPPEHLNLISPAAIAAIFKAYDCELIKWGRLELTPARFVARYGIGLVETVFGFVTKAILPKQWQVLRDTKVHKFTGITYFALKKK